VFTAIAQRLRGATFWLSRTSTGQKAVVALGMAMAGRAGLRIR